MTSYYTANNNKQLEEERRKKEEEVNKLKKGILPDFSSNFH